MPHKTNAQCAVFLQKYTMIFNLCNVCIYMYLEKRMKIKLHGDRLTSAHTINIIHIYCKGEIKTLFSICCWKLKRIFNTIRRGSHLVQGRFLLVCIARKKHKTFTFSSKIKARHKKMCSFLLPALYKRVFNFYFIVASFQLILKKY